MTNSNMHQGSRYALGAVAAISLLASALPAAMAQGGYSNQGGGNNQSNRGGGGWHQDQTGQHGHQWGERTPSGGTVYHQQPSYMSHPYQGSEHRRYYTYQGSEFYINLDTGIRISL